MSFILFEGKIYTKSRIGRVWKNGTSVFCMYDGDSILLKKYTDECQAALGLKYMLYQLGKLKEWI